MTKPIPPHHAPAKHNSHKHLGTYLATALIFIVATVLAAVFSVPTGAVLSNYKYDVLILLIVMELFVNLITETGIMNVIAVKLVGISKRRRRLCLAIFGALMFAISCLLNNITAVLIILPVTFMLLRTLRLDQRYINIFFATLLALCNTGGAASPIGDFPAIVIMTSGITTFSEYLFHAFPLFLLTSLCLVLFWSLLLGKQTKTDADRMPNTELLEILYAQHRARRRVIVTLAIILFSMFLAWMLVPQSVLPPELIAVLGYVIATVFCAAFGLKVHQKINLRSVLLTASFLFLATVVGQTGLLSQLVALITGSIESPKLLLLSIMLVTSLCAGIFSAGPAAAAMMPVITGLCATVFAPISGWVAVAYAASICAGSSLFMSSATAGFILSEHVGNAKLMDEKRKHLCWSFRDYLGYGITNYLIQMAIAVIFIMLVI